MCTLTAGMHVIAASRFSSWSLTWQVTEVCLGAEMALASISSYVSSSCIDRQSPAACSEGAASRSVTGVAGCSAMMCGTHR
jgi:hypothetical protein